MIDPSAAPRHGAAGEELRASIDLAALPRHVGVIMDGNGRWARLRKRARIDGHRAGVEALRELVAAAARLGIPNVTIYGFSAENWRRPPSEVLGLMMLGLDLLKREVPRLVENNIRLRVIGRRAQLDPMIRRLIQHAEEQTAANTGLLLQIAANYSGREEIVDAANELLRRARSGEVATIDERSFADHLYSRGVPDPDLVIRTGGELRISNFLLWQIAYAEIHVSRVLWPDFRSHHLYEAILDFQSRERRFGAVCYPETELFVESEDDPA